MPNFSGKWNLIEQMQGVAAGTWTGVTISELYGWGHNSRGELGDNTTTNKSSPVQIATAQTWTSDREKIGAGRLHSMMIDSSNRLYAIGGMGYFGELGLNISGATAYRSSPIQVGALTNWSQVSGGRSFTGALKTDGTLWMWGRNHHGQLGDNTRDYRSSPVQIGSLTNWSYVQASYIETIALKTDGTLWAWGGNSFGQLGLNDVISRSSPVQVGSLTNWASIGTGARTIHAINTSGELYAWGLNTDGDAGLNDRTRRSSPVQVGALTNWSQVSGNLNPSQPVKGAIKTDGTMWSWGKPGNYISLGQNDMVQRSSPTQIGALTTWSQILPGELSFHAIKTDGTLWGWGYEGRGQVGDNTAIRRSSPVQIGSESNWSALPLSGGPRVPLAISSYTTGES